MNDDEWDERLSRLLEPITSRLRLREKRSGRGFGRGGSGVRSCGRPRSSGGVSEWPLF